MALFVMDPGIEPLGMFDVLDTDASSILGGEIMTLAQSPAGVTTGKMPPNTSTEKAVVDARDGYSAYDFADYNKRYFVQCRICSDAYNSSTFKKFLALSDSGTKYYGVTFGTVVGASGGCSVQADSSSLGPSTISGSGKVTLWDKAGLYAISLDALAPDVVPISSGHLYDTPLPGTILYRGTSTTGATYQGRLTRVVTATSIDDRIGLFVELANNGSLVNTPSRLVGATEKWDRVVIQYLGATHMA